VLVFCGAWPSLASDIEELVEAEHRFAEAAATDGMRDAFLAVLADDGVMFRPGPVNGREWFEASPPPPGVLAWKPVHAQVSRAGDLGYTTGPWRYDLDGREAVFGHYVSIWHRAKGDAWQLVLDIGIAHEEPAESAWKAAIEKLEYGKSVKKLSPERRDRLSGELKEADREFSKEIGSKGPAQAYAHVGTEKIRLYRDGRLPVVGLPAVRQALEEAPVPRQAEPIAAFVAASGGFGYSYGTSRDGESEEGAGYAYLRIWSRDDDGAWKILLDLATATP
jgi:ketosteroid isomerase-like protein